MNKHELLSEALNELAPNAKWYTKNSEIVWLDENVQQPDDETINAKISEIELKRNKEKARQQAKSDRDKALNSITHTLADGSVYQVRPKDIPNYQLAIQMGSDTDWILADNSVRRTTIAELQEVMDSGIQQGKEIWDNYLNAIKSM